MEWINAWLIIKEYAILLVLMVCVAVLLLLKLIRKHRKTKTKKFEEPKIELRENIFEDILHPTMIEPNNESLTEQIQDTIKNLTSQIQAEKDLLTKQEQMLFKQKQTILQQVTEQKKEWDRVNKKLSEIKNLQKNNYYLENINKQKNMVEEQK